MTKSSGWVPGPLVQQAERHHQVLAAIQQWHDTHGLPPTVRELAEVLGRHHSHVHFDLMVLKAQGFLTWDAGLDRTVRLVEV